MKILLTNQIGLIDSQDYPHLNWGWNIQRDTVK